MTYVPGDNWIICDLSGKKVLMSQSRKTWDGLRVWAPLWYPRNPQDFLKGIPDRMNVVDGRPRPLDLYQTPQYHKTDFCLTSPNGTHYVVHIDDDGAMLVTPGVWGHPLREFHVGQYAFTVDNDGAIHVADDYEPQNIYPWIMHSTNDLVFEITVDPDLAVHVTLRSVPHYMEGVFTLFSPSNTTYVVYIVDDMAVLVRPGDWGPRSTAQFIDTWMLTVDDDGAMHVTAVNERHPRRLRMVSTGGFEYMWRVDPDGAVKIGRQGHWWDVPVIVEEKIRPVPLVTDGVMDTTGAVAESGEDVWMEE